MSDTYASTSAPPWARKMWYDSNHIYVEMPVVGHPPITLQFDWTDAGLNKALKLMRKVAETSAEYQGKNGWSKPHPIVKRQREGQKPKPVVTTESRSIARMVLKKLRMI